MPKLDDQISTLQDKFAQLKLRQQRLEERQRALAAHRERKLDTRRKILLGGLVLDQLKRGEIPNAQLQRWLAQLPRAEDKALFEPYAVADV
jgi:hypothetical protein